MAKARQAFSGATDEKDEEMSENGTCLWEGLNRDGGWGLLRCVGLTPSSAAQAPPRKGDVSIR